ncbi:hypothetical protein KAU19_02580 [Candidatus Parcubacteria bacterium]|nr:hypothetical protein [Candidatus Parcubacteria bacterium]
MFETSKDLLYAAIAVSVIGLTAFICWAIFYFAQILRQAFKVAKEMRERLHKVDEVIQSFKEKIEHSTSYLLLIGEGIKKLVEVAKEHTGRGEKKRKVRSKK